MLCACLRFCVSGRNPLFFARRSGASGNLVIVLLWLVIPAKAGIQCLCSSPVFFCSSFQRKLESSFCFCVLFLELKSKSFHSPCGRAGNFSLLVQRKVTKRNTPRHRTFAARKCPALLGAGGPARTRASLRSDMRAFPPPPPAMLGAVKGEEDQEQKARAPPSVASRQLPLRSGGRCPKGGRGRS